MPGAFEFHVTRPRQLEILPDNVDAGSEPLLLSGADFGAEQKTAIDSALSASVRYKTTRIQLCQYNRRVVDGRGWRWRVNETDDNAHQ